MIQMWTDDVECRKLNLECVYKGCEYYEINIYATAGSLVWRLGMFANLWYLQMKVFDSS